MKTQEQNPNATQPPSESGLRLLWANFRGWDKTSNVRTGLLRTWRTRVLYVIVGGAFFGVLSGTFAAYDFAHSGYIARGLAFVSTLLVALASYAGSEILTDSLEKASIRTRAVAELFKSEAYRYIFRVGEYSADYRQAVIDRIRTLNPQTGDLIQEPIEEDEELVEMPPVDMNIEDYVQFRIKDQIYGYYTKKVQKLQKKYNRGKNITLFAGFMGVVLGAISTTDFPFAQHTASWIAFTTSASAAISSYMATNKYRYQIASYQTAANQLKIILARWEQHQPDDTDAQKRLVQETEDELMRENEAWVAELSKKKGKDEDLAAQIPEKK